MSAIIVALLLGATAPPPADDDEPVKSKHPPAAAPAQKPESDEEDEEGRPQPNSTIVVTARRLDAARTQIDAALGSTLYSLTNETIENRPAGETGSIAQILAQAPGVTISGRTLNVRGSPANQVRINNVIVPEAISDPADHLSSRLSETTRLITGTLPAQFGFAPAGVISVTTKNGLYQRGGQAELFAGTGGMIEPAFEWAGSAAGTSLFASGSFERDRSRIADTSDVPGRDRRSEFEGLAFADHVIDAENRVSMVFGGSSERHRISGTTIGPGIEASSDGYAVGTFQHSDGGFTVQASLFGGKATDRTRFKGRTRERRSTFGTQIDASDAISASHTLRFGLLADRSTTDELDALSSAVHRTAVAAYAQDEWKLGPSLTFNPGVRVEWLRGVGSAATVEPRASLVWTSESGATAHAGFARYASAPSLGEQSTRSDLADERDDYYDAGVQQRLGSLTIGLDAYSRRAHNFIVEHETPGSAVPIVFAFKRAKIDGVELSATYAQGPLTAWANLAVAKARARTIIGGEGAFAPPTLLAASARLVPLASVRPVTASGGLTWRLGKLSLSGDVLASSGAVRTLDPEDPNGSRSHSYAVLGLAAVYHVRIADKPADLRLDLTNLTDARYVTSDADNLEGGWTRRGNGRAISIGIEQGF